MEPVWAQQYKQHVNTGSMLLPWPSFGCQQAALAGGIALGLSVAVAGIVALATSGTLIWPLASLLPTPLAATLFGLLLTGMAVHGGLKTQWLNGTQDAPFAGKVTAGVAIGVTTAAAIMALVAFILIPLAILALFAVFFVGVPLSMGGGSWGNSE